MDLELEDDVISEEIDLPMPGGMKPRDYQIKGEAAVEEGWKTYSRQIVVQATGSGKTVLFSLLTAKEVKRGGRVLIVAHTEELLAQAADKLFKATGLQSDREKADEVASTSSKVVVASIQTISKDDRLLAFPDDHFTLIIVDECHRSLSRSYMKVICYFHFGEASLDEAWVMPEPGETYKHNARVLGVTATDDRGDRRSLGQLYQACAYEYGLIDACRDGYLVRPIVKQLPLKIDVIGVKTRGNDLDSGELAERLTPLLMEIARQISLEASTRKTIIWLPSVDSAKRLSEALCTFGMNANFVSGACVDRAEKVEAFRDAGPGSVMCNAMLLCLDMETEVLTSVGFVRHNEITPNHLVANWQSDGTVFFAKPLRLIRRQLEEGERMVSIESRTINLRVTETHRMIVSCNADRKGWKKIGASALRNGHLLPSCGLAQPFPYPWINIKTPFMLSLDECRLIGFWIADGTTTKLQSGGIEHRLCQSPRYPHIVRWIDELLGRLGVNVVRRLRKKEPLAINWSLCRGTGRGSQKRVGIAYLEPYLQKNGTQAFWSLSEAQFDALVEGYWYGDGWHGQAEKGFPRSVVFSDTKKPWIEMLCAIGSVRNWRCAIFSQPSKNPKHKDQWRLRMIKGMPANISFKTPIKIEHVAPEEVWCVETISKNIITRRRGKVLVMGNTEGVDIADVDCCSMLRLTKIRSLAVQAYGRGTRVLPGVIDGLETKEARVAAIAASNKPNMLILDFLWLTDRLDLVKPVDLVTSRSDMKDRMQELSKPGDVVDLLDLEGVATRDLLKSLEDAARRTANRAARTLDPLAWAVDLGDEKLATYEPQTDFERRPPTAGQLALLERQRFDTSKVTCFGQANSIIGRIMARFKLKLATPHQLHFLHQLGLPADKAAVLTEQEAHAAIDRLKADSAARRAARSAV
jgi:superfamily II DNA or RNA helicase